MRTEARAARPVNRGTNLLDALDREWAQLLDDPATTLIVAEWAQRESALAGFGNLREVAAVLAAYAPAGPSRAREQHYVRRDAVLVALLRQATARDPVGDLAARTVAQQFLPACKRLVLELRPGGGEVEDQCAEAVTALYRVMRRPEIRWDRYVDRCMFLKLRREVLCPAARARATAGTVVSYDALSAPARERLEDVLVAGRSAGVGGCGEQLLRMLVRAVDDRVVTAEQARLIAEVKVAGRTLRELAEARGIGYAALQSRYHRTEATVVRLLAAAETARAA
jgi:hypothetical protein